jgi:transcriptional antiterminator NusG
MGKNWYVVHTYSGFEEKVKISLEEKIENRGMQERITKILIPTERIVELKAGKKKESDKKFYPGYILVEMELDDETWHMVKSTPRVTGFVGGKKIKTQFQKGESVRITDGPFSNFNGYVEDVDMDHGRLRVMVSIFGRQTPVELNFLQVEKNT